MATPESRRLSRAGAAFLLSVTGAALLGVYSAHPALPHNPIRLPFAERLEITVLVPQGWKFFTRDPREERILVFRRDSGAKWRSASLGRIAEPAHLFGISRTPRAQGVELGLLVVRMSAHDWQACSLRPEECLGSAPLARSLRNLSPNPTLCGEVGIALQKPIPWAWSRADEEVIMPSQVVRLEVQC